MTLIEVVHFSITIFKEKTVVYTKKTDKTHHNVCLFNKKCIYAPSTSDLCSFHTLFETYFNKPKEH